MSLIIRSPVALPQSTPTKDRLVLNQDTIVCDLRDPRQASAFKNWDDEQLELNELVNTVILRTWILWPKLHNMTWECRSVEIFVETETDDDNNNTITMSLEDLDDGTADEAQYLKDYYDRCHCGMDKMLEDVKLNIKAIEATGDYRFSVMEHAAFVAQMIQQSHEPEASYRLTKKPVETCGRQWNSCDTCKMSKVFLCTESTLAAAARRTMPLVVSAPRQHVYAESESSDSDSSYSDADTSDSEDESVSEDERPKLNDPFRYGN